MLKCAMHWKLARADELDVTALVPGLSVAAQVPSAPHEERPRRGLPLNRGATYQGLSRFRAHAHLESRKSAAMRWMPARKGGSAGEAQAGLARPSTRLAWEAMAAAR